MSVNDIGEKLRRERLRQGLTIDQIVQHTRISSKSIEAIESGAFESLPGVLFTRNFVRLYALDLNLDPEPFVARLPHVDIESAPLPNPPPRPGRTPWDPRITAALASLLWLATATGAGFGAWYYFSRYEGHAVMSVSAAPAPASNSTAKMQERNRNTGQSAKFEAPSAPAVAQLPVPGQTGGFDGSRPVQVILTAREVAWVQISADGRMAFVGVLHPNDTRAIAADAQVKILTGNAGGLAISLNGKPLEPLGPSGQVRTVRLTAEGPQLVERTPPVSPL